MGGSAPGALATAGRRCRSVSISRPGLVLASCGALSERFHEVEQFVEVERLGEDPDEGVADLSVGVEGRPGRRSWR